MFNKTNKLREKEERERKREEEKKENINSMKLHKQEKHYYMNNYI